MIAVPLTGEIRQLVTATPDYFARHGIPQTPEDLLLHQGIGMRMAHGDLPLGAGPSGSAVCAGRAAAFCDIRSFASIRAVKAGLGIGFCRNSISVTS